MSAADLRRYLKSNISENSQPILTNKVSNESLSLHLLIIRKKIIAFISKFYIKIKKFYVKFLGKFSLPLYVFDVKKRDLKRNVMIPSIRFSKKTLKNLNDENDKKIKASRVGNLCPNFYNF